MNTSAPNTNLDENIIAIFSVALITTVLAMSLIVAYLSIFTVQETSNLSGVRKAAIYTVGILFSVMIIVGGNFFYYLLFGSFSWSIFIVLLFLGLVLGIYQIFHLHGLHLVQIAGHRFLEYFKNYSKN
jgi:hypothetical protein